MQIQHKVIVLTGGGSGIGRALTLRLMAAIEVIAIGSLDPTLSLRFLTIGPWFLVAGWLALRHDRLPTGLATLAVIAGSAALFFCCGVAARTTHADDGDGCPGRDLSPAVAHVYGSLVSPFFIKCPYGGVPRGRVLAVRQVPRLGDDAQSHIRQQPV